MTETQKAAIAAIEAQQPKKRSAIWMVGEQLKDMVRAEPQLAELLTADLAGKGMGLADAAQRALALANPDAAVFASIYGQIQETWNRLHGAWIKAAAADAATGEKLRTAAGALAEKWQKEEW